MVSAFFRGTIDDALNSKGLDEYEVECVHGKGMLEPFLKRSEQLLLEGRLLVGAALHSLRDLGVHVRLHDLLALAPHQELETFLEDLRRVLPCEAL